MTYIVDKVFKSINFSIDSITPADFEGCNFENCIFSNTDLSNMNFIDCVFVSCDFSLAKVNNVTFSEVKFIGCKLLGLHFEDCNKLGLSFTFENCQLNLSSFYKLGLKNIRLKNCNLQEVDFTKSDLTNSIFDNCNLSATVFDNTILERADFRTAKNFSIDPEKNSINKAKFSLLGVVGLLDKYNIEIE